MVQDQLFPEYQDFSENFELSSHRGTGGFWKTKVEIRFCHLNHAELIVPVLFHTVILCSHSLRDFTTWASNISVFSFPPFTHQLFLVSGRGGQPCCSSVGLIFRVGSPGTAGPCSRRYWPAVPCQRLGRAWEPCTDTTSQKSSSEPFYLL